jgi:GNAT superfamily N-acetyltransferase
MNDAQLEIIEFEKNLSSTFSQINEEWITEMFSLEEKDKKVLSNPQEYIIEPGGYILFVKTKTLGIIGTGALLKTGDHEYELTKMGVLKSARGLKAGEFLLQALIEKARIIGAKNFYLLTNKKCAAAIHLYEKNYFKHDEQIMKKFGSQYQRCDVAMRYRS